MTKKLLLGLLGCLLTAGVSIAIYHSYPDDSINVWIDNPTDDYITISLDDHEGFGVGPFEYAAYPYPLERKETHRLTVHDGGSLSFQIDPSWDAIMINPHRDHYILRSEVYSSSGDIYADATISWVDAQRIIGPFSMLDQAIMPIVWDVGPTQGLPDILHTPRWRDTKRINKLYRYADFLPAYYDYIDAHRS